MRAARALRRTDRVRLWAARPVRIPPGSRLAAPQALEEIAWYPSDARRIAAPAVDYRGMRVGLPSLPRFTYVTSASVTFTWTPGSLPRLATTSTRTVIEVFPIRTSSV